MGLLDVLNGMQNGPRGQQDPNAKGGMSPITMAILALLAYKGIKHVAGSASQAPSPGAPAPSRIPQSRTMEANAEAPAGGGLGDILGGLLGGGAQAPGGQPRGPGSSAAASAGLGDILGGLLGGGGGARSAAPGGGAGGGLGGLLGGALAGGAAGSILSGGLDSLLKQFQQNGQGQAAQSWVGKGPNQQISANDLARSIGLDDVDALAQHTGMSRDELLAGLSRELPDAIDELTPEGRLPTREEASRWG
ncbi:MAG: YidB family protein [Xanthobacteraceae bacterium]|nr:YidB family protein [Xanthobacteraceae bacterium]